MSIGDTYQVTKKNGFAARYYGCMFVCEFETKKHVGFKTRMYTKNGFLDKVVYIPRSCVAKK